MRIFALEWKPGVQHWLGASNHCEHGDASRIGRAPVSVVQRRVAAAFIAGAVAAIVLAVSAGAAGARPLPSDSSPGPSCRVDVRAAELPITLNAAAHLFIIYREQGRELYFRGGPRFQHALPGSSRSSSGSSSAVNASSPTAIAASLESAPGTGLVLARFPLPPGVNPRKIQPNTIVTKYGVYKPGSEDWSPGAPSVTVLKGKAACGKDRCFLAEAKRINKLHRSYSSLGPNSNTVARTFLARCHVPTNKPDVWAPGWDDPTL